MIFTSTLVDILAEIERKFETHVKVTICWATPEQLADGGDWLWACHWQTRDGRFIGVSEKLKRAPLYVLRYLIFHERLHIALPPRESLKHPSRIQWHHKAFRVAERIWPEYDRANAWLAAHVDEAAG